MMRGLCGSTDRKGGRDVGVARKIDKEAELTNKKDFMEEVRLSFGLGGWTELKC